jgi:hypothetical protein
MVMVGKARKMRKMGSVIPTPQRPVSELLIGIADVTGNGSQSDLECVPRVSSQRIFKKKFSSSIASLSMI